MRFFPGFTLSLALFVGVCVIPFRTGADDSHDAAGRPKEARLEEMRSARVNLDAILEAFREMPGLEARFVEEKKLALLARPLRSEGTIYYLPNRALLRVVDQPKPSSVRIDQRALILREGGREERLDLRSMKSVRPLVEALLLLFSGDRDALDRVFMVEFQRSDARWILHLRPRDAELAHLLDRITIRGGGFVVESIRIQERAGDETEMTILSADPHRVFSAAEREKLFGDAGS